MNSAIKTTLKMAALLTTLLGISDSAFAERYIVIMKNKNVFIQINSQFALANNLSLNEIQVYSNGMSKSVFPQSDAVVEDSLENLNSLVIDSEDASAVENLKNNNQVAYVEKEFFHPAPAPVTGFELSKPWSFDLYISAHNGQPQGEAAVASVPGIPWGINAVKAPQAWSLARYGQGARVAIIDTGIDKDHPALAPNFERGRDFVHDGNGPYSFADKVGHGTHCAGTIGAVQNASGFVGVAPKVRLLSGRVCSDQGCSNIAVAQAINWAIAQKVDVISMSLGGPQSSPAEQAAVEKADRAGIVVVAASGNDGTAQVSYPAAFPSVIAVGAVDRNLVKADFSQWGPELAVVAPGVDVVSSVPQGTGRESKVSVSINGASKEVASTSFQGAPEVSDAQTGELVFVGLGKPEDFQKVGNLGGKYALIQRGEIKFSDKVANAVAANAGGVVIYNNQSGLMSGAITTDGSTVTVPVVMIEQAVGENLVKQMNSGAKTQATVQTSQSDYASFSGTSMATPHVAGVVALIKAANKNLTGANVKAILKATAQPVTSDTENKTGSGLVDAEKAVEQALNH